MNINRPNWRHVYVIKSHEPLLKRRSRRDLCRNMLKWKQRTLCWLCTLFIWAHWQVEFGESLFLLPLIKHSFATHVLTRKLSHRATGNIHRFHSLAHWNQTIAPEIPSMENRWIFSWAHNRLYVKVQLTLSSAAQFRFIVRCDKSKCGYCVVSNNGL